MWACPTQSCFPWYCRDYDRYDYHPYLPCWLHLHRELRGGEESRGWMQSLGVHGAQGGLQRTESEPAAAWGSP